MSEMRSTTALATAFTSSVEAKCLSSWSPAGKSTEQWNGRSLRAHDQARLRPRQSMPGCPDCDAPVTRTRLSDIVHPASSSQLAEIPDRCPIVRGLQQKSPLIAETTSPAARRLIPPTLSRRQASARKQTAGSAEYSRDKFLRAF